MDPSLPQIIGDPGQIQQVLANLLLNAADAMNGSGAITVSSQHLPGRRGGGGALYRRRLRASRRKSWTRSRALSPPNRRVKALATDKWSPLVPGWINEQDEKFSDLNACVIAKPDEFLFVDHDTMKEFRDGYEKFSGKPYPVTFTTSARENRCQEHWLQTDLTRRLGNVAQFNVDGIDLSVRQHNLYVLAEGSLHPSGSTYEAVVDAPVIPMPDDMVEYISSLKGIKLDSRAQTVGPAITAMLLVSQRPTKSWTQLRRHSSSVNSPTA